MATFIGTDSADSINGSAAGGDIILGNGGNDTLTGGTAADTINGGTGNDSMVGGDGGDTYYVDSAADVVVEAASGTGTDTIISSVNYTIAAGSAVEAIVYGAQTNSTQAAPVFAVTTVTGTTGIAFTGNEFAQSLYGTTGNDFLAGGRNSVGLNGDTMHGGAGDDTYLVSNANDVITDEGAADGTDTVFVSITQLEASGQAVATFNLSTLSNAAQVETLSAQSQRDTQNFVLTGNQFAQKVIGNFGNNTLTGGGGADTLIGLDGNDTYVIDARLAGNEVIQETSGNDTITFTATGIASYTLAAGVSIENINLAGGSVTNVAGNELAQTITGTGAAETLNGGGGADTLIGGAGSDTYITSNDGITITEASGAGTDTVLFSGTSGGINIADGASIEVMAVANSTTFARLAYNESQTTGAAAGVYLVGNDVAQTIYGAGGNDILNGDRGSSTAAGTADALAGGAGNDIYRVYTQDDVVAELQFSNTGAFTAADAGGTDTIFTSASYSLATNAGKTVGGIANATSAIEVLSAADQSATTAINLTGYTNAERLIGNGGVNTLDGGLNTAIAANGARVGDTLQGLGGNDAYVIHSANDVVLEASGGGTDTLTFAGDYVGTTANANLYVLAAGSEVDQITLGGTVTQFTGNEFGQVIIGATGNVNETITGGGGADLLQGGGGDDVYNIADNLALVQDTQGANTVNYTGATGGYNVNNASTITSINATGAAATGAGVFLVGNNLVQTITGGAGADILNGNGGTTNTGLGDSLVGGAGNDTYRVYTSNLVGGAESTTVGDQVVEAANGGNDTVYTSANYILSANVENLIAADQANVTTLTLVGNASNNVISGSNGNNVLVGGLGVDTLTGLGGADTFHFNVAAGAADADVIADFNASQGDRISLDAGVFAATGGAAGFNGAVDGAEFQLGTVATGNQATILYDQSTGRIFFDSDGAGAGTAQLFATVAAGTVLNASNFVITPAGTLPTP